MNDAVMRNQARNNTQLLLDIRRGYWLVDSPETLLPIALRALERIPFEAPLSAVETSLSEASFLASGDSGASASAGKSTTKRYVSVISFSGTMTKYSSCGTIGTAEVASAIHAAVSDERVAAIVLDIDSGGGAVNSVPLLIEAIGTAKKKGKPIVCHCDTACSAAYWAASQCDAIFADNTLSSVGSIGAYVQVLDDKGAIEKEGYKLHTIYAPQSSDKNKPYREALEGKYQLFERELSFLVGKFHGDVKQSRTQIKTGEPGVFSGKVFFAEEALSLGLVDGIQTLSESISNAAIRASLN